MKKNIATKKTAIHINNSLVFEKNLSDALIAALPGIFYLASKDGKLLRWNKNLEIITGCSYDELNEMKTIDFVEKSQIPLILNKRIEAFKQGKASAEINLKTKNGNKLIYYITIMPFTYNNEECILGIGIDFTEKKAAEQSLINKNIENKERVKELKCLYQLSEIANTPQYTFEAIMDECINIIPPAFQYPEITCANISFGGKEYKSKGFKATRWNLRSVIVVKGKPAGKITVYYKKAMKPAHEGPFLKEERLLINSIADILSNATERKLAADEIMKLSRLYQFNSAINEMMLKAENKDTLYAEACEIAIKYGKFRMAWIGAYSFDQQDVTPVAYAGHEKGYLKKIKKAKQRYSFEHALLAEGMLNCRYYFCNDIASHPEDLTWKNEALKRGYRSCISLPIIVNSKIIAVFTLFMSEAFFFTKEEVKLLIEVTDNIAYALERIELRNLQGQAEVDLKESEEKFRTLVEETIVGVFIIQEGKFIYVNPEFEKITGYTKEILLTKLSFEQLIHKDDLKTIWKKYLTRITEGRPSDHYTFRALKSNGNLLHIEIIVSSITFKSKPAIIGTIIDVSEEVEEEKRISKAVTVAQENERKQISMELHDNVKQIMVATLLNVDFIPKTLNDPAASLKIINNVKKYLQDAINELRRISHQLAPVINSALSLKQMLKRLVDAMNVSNSIHVSYQFEKQKGPINKDIQLAIYRILQEQFSNILKHANATEVSISLSHKKGKYAFTIQDNGKGFDTSLKKSGIGLENIKRRVQAFNGSLIVNSAPGKGCILIVEVPLG